jgi:hypothetical protein
MPLLGNAILPPGMIFSGSPNAILSFLEEEKVTLNQNNLVAFKLWLNPKDPLSPKTWTNVHRINGEESPCEIIAWANVLQTHVFPGLGADTGPLQKAVLNNLLEGTPCTIFTTKLRACVNVNHIQRANMVDPDITSLAHMAIMAEPIKGPGNTSCEIIRLVINDIIECMMPRHALSRVRRYLSRQCTKPREMYVCSFYQCLMFINTQELHWLPPFERGQAFDDTTIKEILLFATPPVWQCEMDQMGFDPTHQDSLRVLQFMENIEAAKTSIPIGSGARSLLSRFSAHIREAGHRNANP